MNNIYLNLDDGVYDEVFVRDQYQFFQKVEKGDLVVDLGCSKGYFYFKNKDKNIKYIGVDSSIDCINDFYLNLNNEKSVFVLNAFLDDGYNVSDFKSIFHNTEPKKVSSITFSDLAFFIGQKIDFLKFDIEGYEKLFLEKNYDLFKSKVKKFSGEIHFLSEAFPRATAYRVLDKLKADKDLEFKLYSVDGVDITNSFWNNKDYYTEIIINGNNKFLS